MSGRGRGAYYKAKYGGGGRGHGQDRSWAWPAPSGGGGGGGGAPRTSAELAARLHALDGRPYPAFRDLERCPVAFPAGWTLILDRAQADPYAPPSRLCVAVPAALAGVPAEALTSAARVTATADFLARRLAEAVDAANGGRPRRAASGEGGWAGDKGGDLGVSAPGAAVLPQTAVEVCPAAGGAVTARLTVALPARGRSIRGAAAAAALTVALPAAVEAALVGVGAAHGAALARHADAVEDAAWLRGRLPGLGLVAFVADGCVLPRATGAHEAPLPSPPALPFAAPADSPLAVTVDLPHAGPVRGLGLPRGGVTAVVGGAFHGKSTLLSAIAAGVYDHPPGDGRALCVTDAGAVTVRAEDGRRVEKVDIGGLINPRLLPGARPPAAPFSTDDASGSTSQAAAIFEAVELGATALLVDEDAAAANLLARDGLMSALVPAGDEPITSLVARARELGAAGVSIVVAIGASGAFLGVADAVLRMKGWAVSDVTADARALLAGRAGTPAPGPPPLPPPPPLRLPLAPRIPRSVHPEARSGRLKWGAAVGRAGGGPAVASAVRLGDETVPLAGLPQVAGPAQARGVAAALAILADRVAALDRAGGGGGSSRASLAALLDELERAMDADLAAALCPEWAAGDLARPRRFEVGAALNRLRTLEMMAAGE